MGRGWSAIRAEIVADLGKSAAQIDCAHPVVQGAFLRAVSDGDFVPFDWWPVEVTRDGVTATWQAAADALKIGSPEDYVRPVLSQRSLQACADVLGVVCATPQLLAIVNEQAPIQLDVSGHLLSPYRYDGKKGADLTRPITQKLAAMEEECSRVDALIAGRNDPVGITGKGWTVERILAQLDQLEARAAAYKQHYWGKRTGMNCGFFTRLGGKATIPKTSWNWIQGPGTAHDYEHTDYSQRGERYLGSTVKLTGGVFGDFGILLPAEVVATTPELAKFAHHDGVPCTMHHPWLPVCLSLDDGSSCLPPPGGGGGGEDDLPPPPTVAVSWMHRAAPLAAVGGLAALVAAWDRL